MQDGLRLLEEGFRSLPQDIIAISRRGQSCVLDVGLPGIVCRLQVARTLRDSPATMQTHGAVVEEIVERLEILVRGHKTELRFRPIEDFYSLLPVRESDR